jgi:hypothetical protein
MSIHLRVGLTKQVLKVSKLNVPWTSSFIDAHGMSLKCISFNGVLASYTIEVSKLNVPIFTGLSNNVLQNWSHHGLILLHNPIFIEFLQQREAATFKKHFQIQ